MRKNRIKSLLYYIGQTAVIALIIGYIIYTCAFRMLIDNLEGSLIEVSKQGATAVEVYINSHIRELTAVSLNSIISNSSLAYEERLAELEKQLKLDDFIRLGIVDLKGNAITTDDNYINIGDREYFLKAAAGIGNVSDPVKSPVDGTMIIVFAVPIYENQNITGVLYGAHDADVLSEITDKIRLGPHGSSYIVNKFGDAIAHDNRQLVYSRDNIIGKVQNDPDLKKLEELERKMIAGLTGAGEYTYQGINKYMGFSPIVNSNWSIAVTAPKSQVFEKINQVLGLILFSVFLVSIIITIISIYSNSLKRRLFQEQKISNRVIDIADIIVLSLNRQGEILTSNRFGEKLFDKISQDSFVKVNNLFDLLPDEESLKLKDIFAQGKFDKNFELSFKMGQNDPLHVLCAINRDVVPIHDTDEHFILTGIDITERVVSQNKLQASFEEITAASEELAATEEELRSQFDELIRTQQRLLESEERYYLAVEGSNDALWDWSIKDNQIYYSDKFYEIIGYAKDEIDNDITELIHPEDIENVVLANNLHLKGDAPFIRYEFRVKTKNEGYKWLLNRGKAIIDDRGRAVRIAGSITDINETKNHENMIRRLAYFDALTGLPNRVVVYEETAKSIQCALENNYQGALIFIDLDNFKNINDSCGHSVGDLLLVEIGIKLSEKLKDNGIVSRLGGDEFIVLIKDFREMGQLEDYFRNIIGVFHIPFNTAGNILHISASCGIALFPDDGTSVDVLLKNADIAMYHAKNNGKNTYVMFDKTMNDQFIERINLEDSLRKALANNEFIMHYQPQIDLVTGQIYGFEALIRWISPQYGYLMPLRFINIAEESGLIIPIGKWVIRTACYFIKFLHEQGYDELKIAVNVSVLQLMQTDFIETILNILDEVSLAPSYLELELTETVLMETIGANFEKLKRLQELGVVIAIDDFGKGYSSLSYLQDLPVNKLKIDKSFIDGIGSNKDLTEAIVKIGHKSNLSVVAEGVETKDQLEFLLKTNCNFAQGFLFGMPVTAEEGFSLLKQNIGGGNN